MSEEIKSVVKGIVNSGITKSILIIFFVIFVCLFAWNVFQGNYFLTQITKSNQNIEDLIRDQAEIKKMKRGIKEAYDNAMTEFNDELKDILGETLKENNVVFPQRLNDSINEFKKKAELIKDCLIFPEDLEWDISFPTPLSSPVMGLDFFMGI